MDVGGSRQNTILPHGLRSKYLSLLFQLSVRLSIQSPQISRKYGELFKTSVTLGAHISAICTSCVYRIRDLRCICQYISLRTVQNCLLSFRVALIAAFYFCLKLQTGSSPNIYVSRIDLPLLWQSQHDLLVGFHCCFPSTGRSKIPRIL